MSQITLKKPFSGNTGVLIGGFLALLFLNVLNSSYSTVLGEIKNDLLLSYTMSGALMSSYFLGYTIGQIPWGYLADRTGSRLVIALNIFGASVSTVMFGLSLEIQQVIVARFLVGLLGAGTFVSGVKMISIHFQSGERGTALGILNIGGSVGLILASWVTPALSLAMGWRSAIVVFGVVGVVASAPIWMMLGDRKMAQSIEKSRPLGEALYSRNFWVLASVQFIRLGSYYTFIAWLPLLMQEEYGLSVIAAGSAFSLFNLAGMLSNPLGGFFSDRVGERAVILLSFCVLASALVPFTMAAALPIVYLSTLATGWFINFVRSPSFTILPRIYGVEASGRISGAQNTFASIGALSLPLLLGYVRDSTQSYQAGFIVLFILSLLAALLCIMIRRS